MPNTFTKIASSTVGSGGAASITFSSIPSTYTDLQILLSARDTDSANNWYLLTLQLNTDTTNGNYSTRILYGFGSTAGSGTGNRQNTGYVTSNARTADTFGNLSLYLPNYAGSNNKSFSTDTVTEGNGSTVEILGMYAGLWSNTSAINQIILTLDVGNFAQYSTATLYGIKSS